MKKIQIPDEATLSAIFEKIEHQSRLVLLGREHEILHLLGDKEVEQYVVDVGKLGQRKLGMGHMNAKRVKLEHDLAATEKMLRAAEAEVGRLKNEQFAFTLFGR